LRELVLETQAEDYLYDVDALTKIKKMVETNYEEKYREV
jgi:hypothetical protein